MMSELPENTKPRRGWRVWGMPLALLVAVGGVFVLGKIGALPDFQIVIDRAGELAGSYWALPAMIGVFCVAALLGIPQFALMAGAVAAFGAWQGMLYAWVATLFSGTLTYGIGRWGGQAVFDRLAGPRARKVARFLGQNAFKASALVRMIPSGPFLIVNMAFGASGARFTGFLAGLAVGAWPKLIMVALATQGVIAAEQGAIWIAIGALIVAGLVWGVTKWLVARADLE